MKAFIFICFAVVAFANTHIDLNSNKVDPKQVAAVLKGVVEGIGLELNFTDFGGCIHDGEAIIGHLNNAFNLFSDAKSVKDVLAGLAEVGAALQGLPQAFIDCSAAVKHVEDIAKWIQSFANPTKYIIHVFEQLLINGVDVLHEVKAATAAWKVGNWEEAGKQLGHAIAKVFLQSPVIPEELVAEINSNSDATFVSTVYPQWKKMTVAEWTSQYLGFKERPVFPSVKKVDYKKWFLRNAVPDTFDSRVQWPNCIKPIRDQGQCGSCWAFGASESLTDRFCIATKEKVSVVLSPQYQVSCDDTNYGCSGGYLDNTWYFLEDSGLVTDSCWPYKSGKGSVPSCASFKKCEDGQPIKNYYVQSGTTKGFGNPESIKTEIYTNGPIETGFDVYQDFISYKSGIYKHSSGGFLGGHAVKILGWGVENNVKYWLAANSWNTMWGEQGFFRIQFGQCGFDSDGIAGIPDVNK